MIKVVIEIVVIEIIVIENSSDRNKDGNNSDKNNGRNSKNNKPRNLLICHGAGLPLEFCYHEYIDISLRHNVNIISLEYPGFGVRKDLNKDNITEVALFKHYPEEVRYMMEEYLKIPWENTILLGQCFGAPIATVIASSPSIRHRLKSLYLTKPMPPLRDIANDLTRKLINHVVPLLFVLDEKITNNVLTSVVIIHPELDNLCKIKRSKELIERFKNSVNRTLCTVFGVGHKMTMYEALENYPLR